MAGAVPVVTNGLVAAYEFNGNADDVSGNGNNGVVIGATLTADQVWESGLGLFILSACGARGRLIPRLLFAPFRVSLSAAWVSNWAEHIWDQYMESCRSRAAGRMTATSSQVI